MPYDGATAPCRRRAGPVASGPAGVPGVGPTAMTSAERNRLSRRARLAFPARRSLVAPATALLHAGVVARFGVDADAWLPLALVAFCVPIALIDLDHRVIPDRLTAPAAVVGLAVAAAVDPAGLPERLLAAGGAGGGFLLVALVAPEGMGMGDAKLVGVLGLFLGASVVPALLVALVAGTLAGVVVMARKGVRDGRKTALPFGPFLVLGGLVALFAGESLVNRYLQAL